MSDAVEELRRATRDAAAAARDVAAALIPLRQALGRATARAQQLAHRGGVGGPDVARRIAAADREADQIAVALARLGRALAPVLTEAEAETE
jgi:hypothetical protein